MSETKPDFVTEPINAVEALLMNIAATIISPGLGASAEDLWNIKASGRMTPAAFNLGLWRLCQRQYLVLRRDGTYTIGRAGWSWINENISPDLLSLREEESKEK